MRKPFLIEERHLQLCKHFLYLELCQVSVHSVGPKFGHDHLFVVHSLSDNLVSDIAQYVVSWILD